MSFTSGRNRGATASGEMKEFANAEETSLAATVLLPSAGPPPLRRLSLPSPWWFSPPSLTDVVLFLTVTLLFLLCSSSCPPPSSSPPTRPLVAVVLHRGQLLGVRGKLVIVRLAQTRRRPSRVFELDGWRKVFPLNLSDLKYFFGICICFKFL